MPRPCCYKIGASLVAGIPRHSERIGAGNPAQVQRWRVQFRGLHFAQKHGSNSVRPSTALARCGRSKAAVSSGRFSPDTICERRNSGRSYTVKSAWSLPKRILSRRRFGADGPTSSRLPLPFHGHLDLSNWQHHQTRRGPHCHRRALRFACCPANADMRRKATLKHPNRLEKQPIF